MDLFRFEYIVKAIITLVVLPSFCFSLNSTGRTHLRERVLEGYNKRVYPGGADGAPLQLNVYFTLISLREFDERMSKLSVFGFMTASWTDERLVWSQQDSVSSLLFYQNEIWTPQLVLWNSFSSIDVIGFNNVPVRTWHNGLTKWNPGEVFETSCDADVSYFPFDTQQCTLDFSLYEYTTDDCNITLSDNLKAADSPSLNTMWEVIGTEISLTETNKEQVLHVEVTFKRRSLIYVLNIIIPTLLMSFVNLCVFYVPAGEGNRLDFATTILLTMSVSMTTVAGYLPQSSLPQISFLCYMVSLHVIMSMVVLIFTIVSIRIYHKDDNDVVPTWIKLYAKLFMGKQQGQIAADNQSKNIHTEVEVIERPKWAECLDNPGYEGDEQFQTSDGRVNDCTKDEFRVNWKVIGASFDKFSFVFLLILISCLDSVIIIILLVEGEGWKVQ